MSWLTDMAYHMAVEAHEGQSRKYDAGPYINHPIRVAFAVSQYDNSPTAIAAALLHDTLEDTSLLRGRIALNCGEDVAQLVESLTSPPGGTRAERKKAMRFHYAKAPQVVKLIKWCDRVDNLKELSVAVRRGDQEAVEFWPLYALESLALFRESLSDAPVPQEHMEASFKLAEVGMYEAVMGAPEEIGGLR